MTQSKDRPTRSARRSAEETPALANGSSGEGVPAEERHRMIAEAAYYRALQRGFAGGDAFDDWMAAEQEIDAALLAERESADEPRQREMKAATTKSARAARESPARKS